MGKDENAAIAAAAKLLVAEDTETEDSEDAPEVEAAEQETVEEEQLPEFEPELPEDIAAELSVPEDSEFERDEEDEEDWEALDDRERQLLARAKAAERKAEHYENLRVGEATKAWTAEATKFFPLSVPFLSDVKATSRKAFLRAAKARHEAVLPLVKPITDQAKRVIEQEREKVRAEEKAAAEKAWGKQPSGATNEGVPTEATITQDQLERNRAKGDLAGTIKQMIWGGTSNG